MPLILRKCWSNGLSSRNFCYGYTGDIVTAPDWNPKPECGNGLHGLLEGNGRWRLLEGSIWLVIEAETEDIVEIDDQKCKFRTGKILFRGTTEQLRNSEFPTRFNLTSESACEWALDIGNRDVMINKITESRDAYGWARYIGNHDIMIHKITNSECAYYWALNIGNRDIMIDKITDSEYAYLWAVDIGNHDIMMDKINDSRWAYNWARDIGNHDVMIDKITDSRFAYCWALTIGNHDVMKSKITDPEYIKRWNEKFPYNSITT